MTVRFLKGCLIGCGVAIVAVVVAPIIAGVLSGLLIAATGMAPAAAREVVIIGCIILVIGALYACEN